VLVLVARRTGDAGAPVPLGLDRELGDALAVCRVGPLTLAELDRLLDERAGVRLVRPRLERLHRVCSGNPLYALEIARSLKDADDDELPLPPRLSSALETRVRALPDAARDAALLAAACVQPTARLVELAAGGTDGLADAIARDVLQLDGRRLRFTHPLLAEATYAAAAPWEQRAAHARLAAVATSTLERAHQLARATEEPDDEIASELAAAAGEASARGVPATAAELAAAAARLTVDAALRDERAITAAELKTVSGDPEGARADLESLAARLPTGPVRARVLALIGDLLGTIDPERSLQLQVEALAAAADAPELAAEIELGLATTTWNVGRLHESTAHMRDAVALAERAESPKLLGMCLGELLHCEMMLGLPLDEAMAARALELETTLDLPAASYFRPSISLAIVYTAIDRLDDARRLLDRELARIEAVGDEAIRWGVLARITDLELRLGNFGLAVARGRESLEAARLLDHAGIERFALNPYAAALARVGELAEARERAAEALAQSDRAGSRFTALRARGTLGFCALSEGRADEAWRTLEPAVAELRELGVGELSIFGVVPDAVEALVALDRAAEANALVEWIAERGEPAGRAWHRAVAARGRALVASSSGDLDAARAALDEALAAHDELPQPFELARTLLVQGTIERRAKHRGPARSALTKALELFDHLGAALWAERATAELARIPGRAPASRGLSGTERRVAELVASGLSNKDVAARMFVTVRTVEANLSKVYAKLGVRSRSELASRFAQNGVDLHD
jgi:DNA-binding NarL/FixJ family response regulator